VKIHEEAKAVSLPHSYQWNNSINDWIFEENDYVFSKAFQYKVERLARSFDPYAKAECDALYDAVEILYRSNILLKILRKNLEKVYELDWDNLLTKKASLSETEYKEAAEKELAKSKRVHDEVRDAGLKYHTKLNEFWARLGRKDWIYEE